MKRAGIIIAIDDFGTGYSSLAREQELSVNCLKIHKTFIDRVCVVGEEQAIAGDIISMAHRLGHAVVAEGVEQEVQKEYLIKRNCDYLQGFLFSRPVNEEAAISLLERRSICRLAGVHSSMPKSVGAAEMARSFSVLKEGLCGTD